MKIDVKSLIIKLSIIVAVLVIDLATKAIFDYKNITIIEGVISFEWQHNTGAAWSILSEHTWLLTLISSLFIVGFSVFDFYFNNTSVFYSISYALCFAGALGNLIDRLFLGYVRDFIFLDFIKFTTYPTFNVADMCLVVGVILFAICILFSKHEKQKNEK